MNNLKGKIFTWIAGIYIIACFSAFGSNSNSIVSGDWSNAATWPLSKLPLASDNITISSGQTIAVDINVTVAKLTIDSGGTLTFKSNSKLIINGAFTVNGTVVMTGGDIALPFPNSPFVLGANSSFTWDPATNNAANATLFVNGVENFASTSTLIINRWYNYTTLPLGSVVSGNFGNLVINTNSSGTILEWNQNNQFESHKILGTLTVDQGWVTLDKSGAISNTIIGNIILKNVNSYFTAYNGAASPNFTLSTSGISNNGGTFFGIFGGKGNITLNVTGNVNNIGNFKVIDNNGLMGAGMCNGNATLNVGGTFSQSAGDTRIIYNLYTTTSGTFNVSIGTLNVTGGIFMGHYSCHTAGAASSFSVTNACTISLANTTDKFRCIGMTTLSSNVNNQKLNFKVGGDLSISGNAAAEFTSTASSGDETDSINGNFQINSCLNNFNYGTSAAAHNTILAIGGTLTINGGTSYLSRLGGNLASTTSGITITNGTVCVKGDIGSASVTVNGPFNQSGGKFFYHSNYSNPTPDAVSVTVNGDFTQSSGLLNFDDCAASAAGHALTINGANYTLSGAGVITRTGTVSFSNIYFGRQGNTQFNRLSNSHSVQQVKQFVNGGCTLNVNNGNLQLASSDSAGNYFLTILSGGTVNMNSHQIYSNGVAHNCSIRIDSGATLKTASIQGLYDGTQGACINAVGNMNFSLDANSVIEYNGNSSQVVTGIGGGTATSANQKYGVLRINFSGSAGTDVYPSASNVYVRTRLELNNGEYNLNGYELTVESGSTNSIVRTNGYIKSETNAAYNPSILTWKNVSTGAHEFPFGVNAISYVPVIFTPVNGMGGDVSISTRATATSDNTPYPRPSSASLSSVTLTNSYAQSLVIDRWWNITAVGFTANVTLSYLGSENTLNDTSATGTLDINQWNGSVWKDASSSGTGVKSGVGTVTVNNTSLFSAWMVAGQPVIPIANLPMDTIADVSADDLIIESIGPNPFTTVINIAYTLYQNGPVYIQVTDLAGKVMYKETVNGVAGSNNYTFNENINLNTGIYLFNMTYHGTTTIRKIVKN